MAAEIVVVETPTGVEEVLSVETEVVLVEALVAPSQAFPLDATSVEIHARFRLNQTGVSQFCAVIVSVALIPVALNHDARLTKSHPLAEASAIAAMTDLVDLPQVLPLLVQA